ncbi:MAG: hypothetical protein R3F61_32455 [Myxococcota bacterium]
MLAVLAAFAQTPASDGLPSSATERVVCTEATLGLVYEQRDQAGGAAYRPEHVLVFGLLKHGDTVLGEQGVPYGPDPRSIATIDATHREPVKVPADLEAVQKRVKRGLQRDEPLLDLLHGMGLSWMCEPLPPNVYP